MLRFLSMESREAATRRPITSTAPGSTGGCSSRSFSSFLLKCLQPERILAVGRKAEWALKHVGAEAGYVRHPSQGGATLFEAGVQVAMQDLGLADGV